MAYVHNSTIVQSKIRDPRGQAGVENPWWWEGWAPLVLHFANSHLAERTYLALAPGEDSFQALKTPAMLVGSS